MQSKDKNFKKFMNKNKHIRLLDEDKSGMKDECYCSMFVKEKRLLIRGGEVNN